MEKVIVNVKSSKEIENPKKNTMLIFNSKLNCWETTTLDDIQSPILNRINQLEANIETFKTSITKEMASNNVKMEEKFNRVMNLIDNFNK